MGLFCCFPLLCSVCFVLSFSLFFVTLFWCSFLLLMFGIGIGSLGRHPQVLSKSFYIITCDLTIPVKVCLGWKLLPCRSARVSVGFLYIWISGFLPVSCDFSLLL